MTRPIRKWIVTIGAFAFALLLFTLGDVFDAAGYLVAWSLFLVSHRRLVRPNIVGERSSLIILALAIHLAAAGTLNRVDGYPDKEMWPFVVGAGWFCIHLVALVWYSAFWRQRRVLLILACVVYMPFVELPAWSLRQAAGRLLVEQPPAADFALIYFSKIGKDKAYAVGRKSAFANDLLVSVYDRAGCRYRFEKEVYLHYYKEREGQEYKGTMDKQSPNLPWMLKFVLRLL